jgi:endoplasmic reticulum resident protein 44
LKLIFYVLADIAGKYHINKYPTLKLFRNGQVAKREYRGQRSVEAIAEFIRSQTKNSMKEFATQQEMESKLEVK